MDFHPKMITMAKAYLLDSQALALGADAADGLTTEVWWTPDYQYVSSIDGKTGKEITDEWTKAKGTVWTQPMGYKYASMELAIDILKRAQSLDKETIRQAIGATDLDTLVGHIKFD
jgi:branched-chain amino acid transport system substrate-binding protein